MSIFYDAEYAEREEMEILDSAARAYSTVYRHAGENTENTEGFRTHAVDLLADIAHALAQDGESVTEAFAMAKRHAEGERGVTLP